MEDLIKKIEKLVPRFRGIKEGEIIRGAGCYTNENGKAFIITDGDVLPEFNEVEEIKYDIDIEELK